jgi:hypothetical protein
MRATGGKALLVSVAVLTAWTVGCCIFFGPGTRGVFGPEIPRRVFLWTHARAMISLQRLTVFEVGPEHQSRLVFDDDERDGIESALIRGERVRAIETTLYHGVWGVWAPSVRTLQRGRGSPRPVSDGKELRVAYLADAGGARVAAGAAPVAPGCAAGGAAGQPVDPGGWHRRWSVLLGRVVWCGGVRRSPAADPESADPSATRAASVRFLQV